MTLNKGVYPTMITPYTKENKIDYDNVERLVNWYTDNRCDGIFAVCQSSEMSFLSLKERIELAAKVVQCAQKAPYKVNVVASGHCADDLDEQIEEIISIHETGIDAFVLVSNRFDLHNEGDKIWLRNAEYVLNKIPDNIPLGIYECPKPYKRLLTAEILDWCIESKRFHFIKDTCCDPLMITGRLNQLKNSDIMLYNANAQTLLYSLKNGAAGYSGIMANYHPDLLVWLCNNFDAESEKSENLSNILSMAAFTENSAYPCTAKYYLGLEGIEMNCFSRNSDEKQLTEYQKLIMKQLYSLNQMLRRTL